MGRYRRMVMPDATAMTRRQFLLRVMVAMIWVVGLGVMAWAIWQTTSLPGNG